MFRKVCIALAATASFALASGCFGGGGPEKVDAEDWVDDLCAATDDLSEAEFDGTTSTTQSSSRREDGEAIRDALVDYVEAYDEALGDFLKELEERPTRRPGRKQILDAVKEWVADERKRRKTPLTMRRTWTKTTRNGQRSR